MVGYIAVISDNNFRFSSSHTCHLAMSRGSRIIAGASESCGLTGESLPEEGQTVVCRS